MFFFVFVSRNFNEKSNEKQIKKNTWKINEKGRHFCGVEFFVFLLNDLLWQRNKFEEIVCQSKVQKK